MVAERSESFGRKICLSNLTLDTYLIPWLIINIVCYFWQNSYAVNYSSKSHIFSRQINPNARRSSSSSGKREAMGEAELDRPFARCTHSAFGRWLSAPRAVITLTQGSQKENKMHQTGTVGIWRPCHHCAFHCLAALETFSHLALYHPLMPLGNFLISGWYFEKFGF